MSYEDHILDAQYLLDALPEGETRQRIQYLLGGNVAGRAVHVTTRDLYNLEWPVAPDPKKNFGVVDTSRLEYIDPSSPLAPYATGRAAELTWHQSNMSGFVLPVHSPAKRIGNGAVLLHALQHIEDRELFLGPDDGSTVQVGQAERNAYGLNAGILEAIDGQREVGAYVESTPLKLTVERDKDGGLTARCSRDMPKMSRPPSDTMMSQLWDEGGHSRYVLLGTVQAKSIEQQAQMAGVTEWEQNNIVGHVLGL